MIIKQTVTTCNNGNGRTMTNNTGPFCVMHSCNKIWMWWALILCFVKKKKIKKRKTKKRKTKEKVCEMSNKKAKR